VSFKAVQIICADELTAEGREFVFNLSWKKMESNCDEEVIRIFINNGL
jgi:hypothetical protein